MVRWMIFILVLQPILAFPQVPDAMITAPLLSTPNVRHIWLGASFASEVAYRTLWATDLNETTSGIIDWRNDREIPRFGYTTSLNLTYMINAHWSVGVGLGYSRKGYRTKDYDLSTLSFGDIIDPRRGFIYETDDVIPEKIRYVYGFEYITAPLHLTFTAGKGKLRSVSSVGLGIDRLIRSTSVSVSMYKDAGWSRKTSTTHYEFIPWNISPMISSGVALQLSERMRLSVAPVARYGVMPIIDTSIKGRLWSVGLDAGFQFAL